MKRRDLLKSTMAIATSPFIIIGADTFATSGAINLPENPEKQGKGIPRFKDGRDWFFERRYGMFIHWGIYSVAGWHEQHMYRRKLSRAGYAPLMREFNPLKFNPDAWLDLAEDAGMKYITFTTKHVDGFCMWDTKQTDYKVTHTPYAKDTLAMLAEACHRRKFPLCLYYSLADMHQQNYPNAGRPYELPSPEPGDQPDVARYIEFVKEQVRELCTNYGTIHGFWWDANVIKHHDASINAMIRQLQPNAIINNRGCDGGNFSTPERDYEIDDKISFDHPVEACQAVGMESWGFRKDEDFYTDRHLISSIDRYMARNANYLLNVGPTSEGIIPIEIAAILRRIGKWKKTVDESYQKVQPDADLINSPGVLVTRRDRTLYIHLNQAPVGNGLKLKPINVLPIKATLLNTGEAIDCVVNLCPVDHASQQPYLRLRNLPVNQFANTVLVAKLEFDRPLEEITQTKISETNIELTK